MHYNRTVSESVNWSKRGKYMEHHHGITPAVANDALSDPQRVLIEPDYNSKSGAGIRIIGYSTLAQALITVIALDHEGLRYGVNGWKSNAKDRRIYLDGEHTEQKERTNE